MTTATETVRIAAGPATMTVDEAAGVLGLSRNAAYAAVNRGEIPSIRIGRRVLVPRERLRVMLETPAINTVPAAAAANGLADTGWSASGGSTAVGSETLAVRGHRGSARSSGGRAHEQRPGPGHVSAAD